MAQNQPTNPPRPALPPIGDFIQGYKEALENNEELQVLRLQLEQGFLSLHEFAARSKQIQPRWENGVWI